MIHFSVDDTIDIFKDLTLNNYESIFDNDILKFFKQLHDKYNFKVSMYCFYEKEDFNLSMCSDKYKDEFQKNSDWLKFGFHALKDDTNYKNGLAEDIKEDFNKVIDALKYIVSDSAITYDVRLGFGQGNKECVKMIKDCCKEFNILYGVDDDRIVYYLSKEENDIYLKQGFFKDQSIGITIKNCKVRLENNKNIDEDIRRINSSNVYAFFTHEVHLHKKEIQDSIKKLCESREIFV